MGNGACIKRMGAVKNYSTNTIMEKTNRGGREGGVKDIEFSGVLKKEQVDFPGVNFKTIWNTLGVIKENYVELPGVLVLGLKISEGCNTITQIF